MTTDGDAEARKLGEKLLLDVEVEGLSSTLNSLRALESEKWVFFNCLEHSLALGVPSSYTEASPRKAVFGFSELDNLIPDSSPTILELVSPPPAHHPSGAGKTSLLYLIIAHAILPATFEAITDLNGHDAAVILFDPLHHFSVPRLASVMLHLLTSKLPAPLSTLDSSVEDNLRNLITRCLDHVHIFRPQSWDSMIATLLSLPDYLFDPIRHKSTFHRIEHLILEDIDAFAWSLRAAHSSAPSAGNVNPLSAASEALIAQIANLSTLLSCNVILTSPSILSTSFRPALPTSWPSGMIATRLAVRRVEVLKFAPEMSVEQAEAERRQRWEVVQRGRFECWKVGTGVGARDGKGFVFRIGRESVGVERDS